MANITEQEGSNISGHTRGSGHPRPPVTAPLLIYDLHMIALYNISFN